MERSSGTLWSKAVWGLTACAGLGALAMGIRTAAGTESNQRTPTSLFGAVAMPPGERPSLLPEVPSGARTVPTNDRVYNSEAAIPPQCYTKTEGRFNPCYTCHQSHRPGAGRAHGVDDGALQGRYGFSEVGTTNHFTNLFVNRTSWIASISDEQIERYVAMDNYSELAGRLEEEGFQGFIPDLVGYQNAAKAFDEKGLARDKSQWVAFNYKPFPGTFWPTNGSVDDVLIRLPAAFRQKGGVFSSDVYYVNLTLAELNLKGLSESTLWEMDERVVGSDLNGDGTLSKTDTVVLLDHYVGDAENVPIQSEQLPKGTELLHSVRYLGVDQAGAIYVPPRMKELRYMRKVNVLSAEELRSRYDGERKEKRLGQLPTYLSRGDEGLDNALGWFIKGFIEDYDGRLRPQTLEEDMYCMGCHKAIGTTIDSTFSFARKVPGARGFGYVDLVGMKDVPTIGESGGEILNYLRRVGGGSEFRANPEMRQRWFDERGNVKENEVQQADVASLTFPSRERALLLNKAYTHIVRHQSFRLGRDATIEPAQNVYREVDEEVVPLERSHRVYGWDLRLDWEKAGTP